MERHTANLLVQVTGLKNKAKVKITGFTLLSSLVGEKDCSIMFIVMLAGDSHVWVTSLEQEIKYKRYGTVYMVE